MLNVKEKTIQVDEILDEFSNMVYRLAFSRTKNLHDAQDITQDVFIKLMSYKKNFESDEHLKSWLIRVTINSSKNLLTSAWFRKTAPLEDNLVTHIKEDSEVYKYVLDLPRKYRTVIHLFYYEGFKTQEIADILEVKEGTIRSQLNRARNILRDNIKEEDFDVF
ncbi:sigma-70 family RNA polymerase sigma factor [uncultured Clostridium sp.]|uniref:sigma-70 family RNA polymerase sigma factor n=1 Tax=uncultured Clostridium sp. TaxID=59620 RepID=UPI002625C88C|nr:sigma-70 family RNA polymerase sigma factor [uncultured Clostridium sp.]